MTIGYPAGAVLCRYDTCRTPALDPDSAILLCTRHWTAAAAAIRDGLHVPPVETPPSPLTARAARRRAALEAQAVVYYVKIGDVIKIGTSTNLKVRLAEFRLDASNGALLATEPGSRDLEQQRHREFAHLRIGRLEHFHPEPELLEHVERILDLHGFPVITTYPRLESV